MKISFVSYIYPYPERGYNPGIERVIQELAQELVRQGHEVHVITTYRNGGDDKYEQDEGVHLHRAPDTRHYFGRAGSVFSLDLLSLNYSITAHSELLESSDVVHAFSPIVWKSFTTPLVAHYHHWDNPSEPMEYLYLPTSQRLWLRCYAIADRVFAVSEYSADDLASRGINRGKIAVVPNGVDPDTYHPGQSPVQFEEWDSVLLFVGPLMERKGLKYLIQAMPDIIEQHPDTGLVLVGGGNEGELLDLAEHLGVRDHLRFEGFVPEDVLPKYYRATDIFVFPSLLEGFGMVLLEAMASGLPVVASDTTAIPEVVGSAGCLIAKKDSRSLAESVNTLLADTSKRKLLSEHAKQRALEDFTWNKSVEKATVKYSECVHEKL